MANGVGTMLGGVGVDFAEGGSWKRTEYLEPHEFIDTDSIFLKILSSMVGV